MQRRLNSLFRDLQTWGTALVTFAVAAAAVVALATEGTTAKAWVVNAVAIIALSGALLVVVGWAGERVTHRDPVSEAHAETLLALAATLATCVVLERPCEYARGYKPREAFHAHYGTTSRMLDRWDALLGADEACRNALRARVSTEAHGVAMATEGRWSLDGEHICRIVFGSTIDRAHANRLDADFSLEGRDRDFAKPERDDGETQEDWDARIARNIARVEGLGRASQGWPQALAVAKSYNELETFKTERLPSLMHRLSLVQEHGRPLEVKRCPTCSEEPT